MGRMTGKGPASSLSLLAATLCTSLCALALFNSVLSSLFLGHLDMQDRELKLAWDGTLCFSYFFLSGMLISVVSVRLSKETGWSIPLASLLAFTGLLCCHSVAKLWPVILLYYYL